MTFSAKANTDNRSGEDGAPFRALRTFEYFYLFARSFKFKFHASTATAAAHMAKHGNKMKLNKNDIAYLEAYVPGR